MRSSAPTLVALLAILVALGPAAGFAAASGGSHPAVAWAAPADESPGSPSGLASDARAQPSPAPNLSRPDPRVVITINLTADGDARWTVASRFNVSNESEVAAFRAYVDSLKEGGSNQRIGYSARQFQRFATVVESGTNRSGGMEIRNASWSGRVENGTGTVALSLTWTNFARTDPTSSKVVLDDVFAASNGTWFAELSDGQRLVINAPPNYGVDSSRFPVDSGTIVLDGPRNLDTSGSPIVYLPVDTQGTSGDGPSTAGPEGGPSILMIGGGVVGAVLVALLVAFLFTRRASVESDDEVTAAGTTDGGETTTPLPESESGTPEAATPMPEGAPESESEPAGESDPASGAGAAATADAETVDAEAAADETEDEDDIDVELLSDEERVERLLSRNGGRMKQANIVSETGWSNAKVSQLLSSMDEDGRIDKLRIGRENLITLPDEDVGEVD